MKAIILMLSVVLLSGCSTISGWRDAAALKAGYTSKAKAEGLLAQVRREYDDRLAQNARDMVAGQDNVVKALNETRQKAADLLYGADFARQLHPHPDRTHLIMDNKINEARALLPPPTVAAMAAQNEEVKKQLDETLTSLDQLKTQHQKGLEEAAAVGVRVTKAEADLAATKQAKLDIEAAKQHEVDLKQADLNLANNKVIAAEHARGDDEKARHAVLEKMSLWLGVFSLIGIAAAIYLPVYKVQTGALGIALGIAAVGIWYITPLVVGVAALSVFVGIGIWMARNHTTATKTTAALVNAVQDIKDKAPEVYASTVKPALTEWTTKYVKDATGATVAVPDKTVTGAIDAQLVAANRV